ncbi:MAG: phytoene desaturase family protein [Brevinematia bacterium]
MAKKVIIIGAGIAGLSSGCYLQMNGFETEIYELHNLPGGLCTSWKRDGYTFDFCIHWLMGSGASKNFYNIWKELGTTNLDYIEWEEYTRIKSTTGEVLTVYTDPNKLERELLRISPDDKKTIQSFCNGIRKFLDFDFITREEKVSFSDGLKMLKFLPLLIRWGSIAVEDYEKKFKSPLIRSFFHPFTEIMPRFPIIGILSMLSFMHRKSAGYPRGGSLNFSKTIEKRYKELGGKIHYGYKVSKIIVRNKKATGVIANGEEFYSDYVISAADGHSTIYEMLEGKYLSKEIENIYRTYKRFPSLIYVSIGLGKKFNNIPASYSFHLKEPIILEDGGLQIERLYLRNFSFDSTLSPEGKTSLILMISTYNDEYWTELKKSNPQVYEVRKKEVAEIIINTLETEFGNIRQFVEVIDVATPATIIRYTNNWHGSYEGFIPKDIKGLIAPLPCKLPGLSNFYMVGQWTTPTGGVPNAAISGRRVALKICRKEGKKFNVIY